jgi:hypothetical protein
MKLTRTILRIGTLLVVASLSVSSAFAKNLTATKTDLSSSANPSVYGQPVIFTATVTANGGVPTGTVTFKQGSAVLAVATLDNLGQASFTTNIISVHPISADYSGDTNFKGSSANAFKQTVTPATITVTGIKANNKSYDATTTATLDLSNAKLVGVVGNDKVTLNAGTANGAFANKNAGKNKSVNLSGLTLTGASAAQYILVIPEATADILPSTLTVAADNQTRAFGAANPTFTSTITGFVNGESLATSDVTGSPSLTTTATATSAAGSYPIAASAGTLASANYSFAFVSGNLTVTPASKIVPQSISIGLTKSADGSVTVHLSAGSSQTCVIEASTDLVHWTAISTNLTDGNGLNAFTDPDAKNFPNRFYRAVTP